MVIGLDFFMQERKNVQLVLLHLLKEDYTLKCTEKNLRA